MSLRLNLWLRPRSPLPRKGMRRWQNPYTIPLQIPCFFVLAGTTEEAWLGRSKKAAQTCLSALLSEKYFKGTLLDVTGCLAKA